ncbi:MAG TPA: transposase [Actinospica sp.]|nr:transposase [Actinospica sp.]
MSEPATALIAQDGSAYAALCAQLFSSLPRSDQRNRGTDYLLGLLAAQGRKSIRNIAALFGGPEVEQRLHHFVCSSTWDWAPMRRALAEFVHDGARPQAWVAAPMIIPKTGTNSIGVDRRFVPELGRVLNAQQAVGVWAASEDFSCPVNWRLHLSGPWLEDGARRRRALIPDRVGAASLEECTAEACVETARDWRLPQRAVIVDGRTMNAAAVVRRLLSADVPFLARVSGGMRLTAVDAALARWSTQPEAARTITKVARTLLRPVAYRNHEAGGRARGGMAAAIRVELERPASRRAEPAELHLLSVAGDRHGGGEEFWLTDRSPAELPALVRLTRLPGRVHRDLHEVADTVGVRDFTGRSYGGWHRHITLASAAHAVRALDVPAPAPARAA